MTDRRTELEELKTLQDAGIVIDFPQRDIHLNTIAPLEIQMLPATK